jgi:hypothetical protein
MSWIGRSRLLAAYVCPRGVFAIQARHAGGGIEIERTIEEPALLASAFDAANHLIGALQLAGISGGDVTLAVRGFGVVHHVLQMPPATDDVLAPIIEREVRRLEPQLGEGVVGWIPLPPLQTAESEGSEGSGGGQQRSFLTAAAPADVIGVFEKCLAASGYRLAHLTDLPAAMQRLIEEFDTDTDSAALVAPLPDGALLGFWLSGALRLIVEPPLPSGSEHEVAALAEEVELGAMFVRQQFSGAHIDRVVIVGSSEALANAESVLTERVRVPAKQLGIPGLSPAALAALGALLDAQSPTPLALGGATRRRREARARSTLESIAFAAVVLVLIVGAWTVFETIRARRAADALQATRRHIEQDSFGLTRLRSTAGQRKQVREAVAAVRLVVGDRVQLQEVLTGIATAVRSPVQLDSISLTRRSSAWLAVLTGSVDGATSARAVQSLHDLYRELPDRLPVDSLKLDQLAYADSSTDGAVVVRFQMSFAVPIGRKD